MTHIIVQLIVCLLFPVTIVSSLIMALLFVIELQDFLSVQVSEELFVDTTRIPNMTINFDITFSRIACPCK